MSEQGLRYNEGKNRLDLLPSDVLEGVGKVLTVGAKKYSDHNWAKGMPWSQTLASLKRHLSAFERGEDYDKESGLPHIDHVLCNVIFLSRFFRYHPDHDDRYIPSIMNSKPVGFDIDGVICDFASAFSERLGLKNGGNKSWYMSYKARGEKMWDQVVDDKEFWLGLKPLLDPDLLHFEPAAYVTARSIPKEWTEEWIELNGFPCNEVVTIEANGGEHSSKAKALKDRDINIFIDDHYRHFTDLNKAGITCFLMDTPYNQRYQVGGRRITHPNQIFER